MHKKAGFVLQRNDYKHLLIINLVFHSCTVVCIEHTMFHSAGNSITLPLRASSVRHTNIDVTARNINTPSDSLIPIVAIFSRHFSFENISFYLSFWFRRFHSVRYAFTKYQLSIFNFRNVIKYNPVICFNDSQQL